MKHAVTNAVGMLMLVLSACSACCGRALAATAREPLPRTSILAFVPKGVSTARTNMVPYIQNAIDRLSADGGGRLYFPKGVYLMSGVNKPMDHASRLRDGVTLRSNITIEGDGQASVIELDVDCATAFTGRFTRAVTTEADNLRNVTIRNLGFRRKPAPFFPEQLTLLIDSGENILIENSQFIGWSGDAIMIGGILRSDLNGFLQGMVRHVRITGNLFDGVDKNNRQAISIFDGEDIEIDANTFVNTTRPDMPGAIDIEPELPTAMIRNIRIHHNKFSNIGGFGGVIGAAITIDLHRRAEGIHVTDNQIEAFTNVFALAFSGKASRNARKVAERAPAQISFERNKVLGSARPGSTQIPFSFRGIDGLRVTGNYFSRTRGAALIGVPSGSTIYPSRNITFTANHFDAARVVDRDINKSLIAFAANVIDGDFSANTFHNSGVWESETEPATMHIFGFEEASKHSDNLTFNANTFDAGGQAYAPTMSPVFAPAGLLRAGALRIASSRYIGISPERGP